MKASKNFVCFSYKNLIATYFLNINSHGGSFNIAGLQRIFVSRDYPLKSTFFFLNNSKFKTSKAGKRYILQVTNCTFDSSKFHVSIYYLTIINIQCACNFLPVLQNLSPQEH
jgi:hypothetical protein